MAKIALHLRLEEQMRKHSKRGEQERGRSEYEAMGIGQRTADPYGQCFEWRRELY